MLRRTKKERIDVERQRGNFLKINILWEENLNILKDRNLQVVSLKRVKTKKGRNLVKHLLTPHFLLWTKVG